MALLFNINIKTELKAKLCLIIPGMQGQYIFTQESFYLQGTLNNINEQDTSFLDCKHKHMMKSGASPEIWSPAPSVTYKIPWFHKQDLFLRVTTLWFWSCLNLFRDGMGPFNLQVYGL